MISKGITDCNSCWMAWWDADGDVYPDGFCQFYKREIFWDKKDTKPDFCKVSWINVCEEVDIND